MMCIYWSAMRWVDVLVPYLLIALAFLSSLKKLFNFEHLFGLLVSFWAPSWIARDAPTSFICYPSDHFASVMCAWRCFSPWRSVAAASTPYGLSSGTFGCRHVTLKASKSLFDALLVALIRDPFLCRLGDSFAHSLLTRFAQIACPDWGCADAHTLLTPTLRTKNADDARDLA